MSATENAIDEAIAAHAAAEGWTGLTTGWMVVVSTAGHDGQDLTSGVRTVYQGGGMPWPLALGLIEAARITLHSAFAAGDP